MKGKTKLGQVGGDMKGFFLFSISYCPSFGVF